jgi:hypothetical protein
MHSVQARQFRVAALLNNSERTVGAALRGRPSAELNLFQIGLGSTEGRPRRAAPTVRSVS